MTQREKKYIGRKRQKKQCRQTYDTAQYHLKTTPTEGTTHPNPPEGRELDMLLLISGLALAVCFIGLCLVVY